MATGTVTSEPTALELSLIGVTHLAKPDAGHLRHLVIRQRRGRMRRR
jgi:hypothetical protein